MIPFEITRDLILSGGNKDCRCLNFGDCEWRGCVWVNSTGEGFMLLI